MRPAPALVTAIGSGVLAGAIAAACNPSRASPGTSTLDVYVPVPEEAGPGDGATDAGGEGGFGLGMVDRAGRPLVSALLVPAPVQETYNAQATFAPTLPRVVQDALEARLIELDTLVTSDAGTADPVDWAVREGGVHPLEPMFLTDALLVDTSKPCTAADGGFAPSYLDIEQESFGFGPMQTHTTCGGRTPSENVVDETLGLLVTADRDGGPTVTQGVTTRPPPATTTFPYLAPPY